MAQALEMRSVLEHYVDLEGLGCVCVAWAGSRGGCGQPSLHIGGIRPPANRVCVCRQVERQGPWVQTSCGLHEGRQLAYEALV